MPECLLCREDKQIMVVGHCNHPLVCLTCAFKLRSLSQNTKCVYCNEDLPTVLLTSDPSTSFSDLEALGPTMYKHGIGYTDPEERWDCYNLDAIKCRIKRCKIKKRFNSMIIRHIDEISYARMTGEAKEKRRSEANICVSSQLSLNGFWEVD